MLQGSKQIPADTIYGIAGQAKADTFSPACNLVIGAYRDEEGKPWVLNAVKAAKEKLAGVPTTHEYLPIRGDDVFTRCAAELLLGADCAALSEGRVVSVQSLSGTGALRVLAEFSKIRLEEDGAALTVYAPNPTWGNHRKILLRSGITMEAYRYLDTATWGLDFDGMLADMQALPEGSVVLLHLCAHNPTGVDPSPEQWEALAAVFAERGHVAWFDSAYQGFASGDLDRDAFAVRHFVAADVQVVIAQSFAKNFGLYGERTGAAHVVLPQSMCGDAEATVALAAATKSQLEGIIRPMYSSPPRFGALLVKTVLTDPELTAVWHNDLTIMSQRILSMRNALADGLEEAGVPGSWDHIRQQIGMFSYTGLTAEQVTHMNGNHVYLLPSGRISLAGLNPSNIAHIVHAIAEAIAATSSE